MANIGHYEKIRALAADSRILAVGGVRAGAESQVTLTDYVANKVLYSLDLPTHVLGLGIAGDNLIVCGADGEVRVYTISTRSEARRISAHQGACTALALAEDGERFATAGQDGYLRLWSLSSGKKLAEFSVSGQPLRAVALSPGAEYAAAAGDDGVVYSYRLASGEKRAMPGHDGPVYALAFTPRDGRLVSGGDDGTLRIWYLEGAIECEVRGGDESGHPGGVLALLFPPTPQDSDGSELGDRIYSTGADGKVKSWRLEDRRKPKSIVCGQKPLHALCFAPSASSHATKRSLGFVFAGGDLRTVYQLSLDAKGAPARDYPDTHQHGFDALAQSLRGAKPGKQAALNTLAPLEEPEALELMIRALSQDRDYEIRALAAQLLGAHGRKDARQKLRERLNDDHQAVREAALAALRAIDGQDSLYPLRAALESRYADLRKRALVDLVPLRDVSPLVPGLIAQKLTDQDAPTRLVALDQLSLLYPEAVALRTAYERGPADLKVEVLIRAAFRGMLSAPEIAPLVSRALDDADDNVRRIAFAVKVLERRPLAALLEEKDNDFARAATEIARRCAALGPIQGEKGPSDEEIKAARAALPGLGEPGAAPEEADLEPLLISMACRTPDTALRGARGLAKLGDLRALGALLQLSREESAVLRREAAIALKELKDQRAKKRLIWMLDDADASVRGAALDAYAKLEGTSLTIAEFSLRSSYEDIRMRGLDRLVKIGPKGRRAAAAEALLEDAIEDESSKVRTEAFRTLWAWHEEDPQKTLDRALRARFPDLRLVAVSELERLGKEAWAEERLKKTIGDRDAGVAKAAYEAVVKLKGKEDPEAHLLAMASLHPEVRVEGARGAKEAPPESVRETLLKLVTEDDDYLKVRIAALETLDKLFPADAAPHYAALGANHPDYFGRLREILSVRVRAAELLAVRHDERLIEPMRSILGDKDLAKHLEAPILGPLRQRAASALATVGQNRLVKYFATELLKDDDPAVREQAARGLAVAAKQGDEGFLLDALGHPDIWVRSWAADGLARLGDARALPVLTGTLRDQNLQVRIASIISFAALGPEGYGGMLQGLADPVKAVQEIIFSIILARDLKAFREGSPPELLTSALSSQRPDVRFAAARALELRVDPELYLEHVIETLLPARPEKASDMKDWPSEEERARLMVGLAEALAGDIPAQRYAAAQVLRAKGRPLEFFRETRKALKIRAADAPWIPDTTPRDLTPRAHGEAETDTTPKKGWLRRLFSGDGKAGETRAKVLEVVPNEEQLQLRRLAFGAYVGLLRQVSSGDDEGHRVRRDSVDRIVDLGLTGGIGVEAALPAVLRALDDPHHLVRKAAFSGLKKLFPEDPQKPLSLALSSVSVDIARMALDELAEVGTKARPQIEAALSAPVAEVRRYAFELLEKLSPKGSLEPLLAALGSEYADLRIGVIERLATSDDQRVTEALGRAMESDHDDLRMRAAELLAERKDDRAVGVLGAFLRADDRGMVGRAVRALVRLASASAVKALAGRIEEASKGERVALIKALGRTRNAEGIAPLVARLEDEEAEVRLAAFEAALQLANRNVRPEEDDPHDDPKEAERKRREALRRMPLAIRLFRAAVRSKDVEIRTRAAAQLDVGGDPEANELLVSLFSDRDATCRINAVTSYAYRVAKKGAPTGPLEEILRAGTRELLLPAAEGLAAKGQVAALQPLLLVARAGEAGERERALLALGTLGDARALEELETIAQGGTEAAPAEPSMQAAAVEALGRIAPKLKDPEAKARVIERVEELSKSASDFTIQQAAIRGLGFIGGERSRAKLEAIVSDYDVYWQNRLAAIRELGKLGDPLAEQTLARALNDYQHALRHAARKALDKLFPNERTRIEFLAVDSQHHDISQKAAAYLAEEGDPAHLLPRLATLKNASLRQRLRYGLMRREVFPIEPTCQLLAREEATARREAAWLIGARSGGIHGEESPFSQEEQKTLASALVKAEDQTAQRWRQSPAKDQPEEEAAWVSIWWAAARVEARELFPRAATLLKGGESLAPAAVRKEAVRLLAALGGKAEEEVLTLALRDADVEVRTAAASGLARILPERAATIAVKVQPFDPVAFGATATRLSEDLLSTSAGRRLALPALLKEGEIAPLLALLKGEGEEERKLDVIAALGRVGGEVAMETLKTLAFDKASTEEPLRKAAYRALRRAQRQAAKAKKYEAQA